MGKAPLGPLLKVQFSLAALQLLLLADVLTHTHLVGVFPNRSACDRLIGAQLLELHESWLTSEKPYFNMNYTNHEQASRVP